VDLAPAGRAARSGHLTFLALLAIVNVPIMSATARGLARGWLPLGDNGFLLVRARDVGTSHHPLLGPWTSASIVVGENVNNPGPIYYDLLAPWVRLLGPWVGLAVGVMLINMAASSLAVVAARRMGGQVAMIGVGAAVVGLQYAMGSELLFDVWQPNALVLPFLAFVVVATAAATGDAAMLPWMLGLGSLVVQTHLSHGFLVVVVSVASIGACVWRARRGRTSVAWRRPLIWSAAVVTAAWCQPVIEELGHPGEGNISRLARATLAGDGVTMGVQRGVRIVAELLVGSPWFTRRSYGEVFDAGAGDPVDVALGVLPSAAVIAVTVVGLGAAAVWHRRKDRPGPAMLSAVAAIAVVGTVLAISTSPIPAIGITSHTMRWAWVVAAVVWAALLCVPLSLVLPATGADRAGRGSRQVGRAVVAISLGALTLMAAANLPTHHGGGPDREYAARPALRELVDEVGVLSGRGTILFDSSPGLRYAEPYSYPVLASLEARGIPFLVNSELMVGQFGEGRRDDGSADVRLWQVEGPDALDVPPGAERVALAEGPSVPVALFVEPIE
jgi:hypothetical protein